jgi:hypothetical protein
MAADDTFQAHPTRHSHIRSARSPPGDCGSGWRIRVRASRLTGAADRGQGVRDFSGARASEPICNAFLADTDVSCARGQGCACARGAAVVFSGTDLYSGSGLGRIRDHGWGQSVEEDQHARIETVRHHQRPPQGRARGYLRGCGGRRPCTADYVA